MPNEEARIEIFEKLTRKMRLRSDFPFQELVKCTPGYVGADLQTLCKEASIIAVERVIRSTEKNQEGVAKYEEKKDGESDNASEIDLR